jgi:hypothetical protein
MTAGQDTDNLVYLAVTVTSGDGVAVSGDEGLGVKTG